ncbi:MAG: AraC family transcriptional regulator [Legionella sp.]|uniref:AraC family transcriptional regulator n=1 Tax=Legionella sp. TaxID=459 RepID=UPI0028459685|nr:AraC family transcriptional regulator [Legionella sp.]
MFNNHIELRSYHSESRSHVHDFAQLVLPLSGSMELEINQYSGVIHQDVGVYIAPEERHCFSGGEDNLFLVIDVKDKCSLWNEGTIPSLMNLSSSAKKLMQFSHHYLTHNERDVFTDALMNQLLLQITTKSFISEGDALVQKARHWIDLHFAEPVMLSQVARHCHLSVSQLQRRFKEQMGCALAEYWRMKKLQKAQALLSISALSIDEVAFKVGYGNLSAFSRRFTMVYGKSPSQWRLTAKQMHETDN